MYLKLIAELILAVLAVFGLYAILRLVVSPRLPPTAYIALRLHGGVTPEEIPYLLACARDRLFLCSRSRLVVLLDASMKHNKALLDALQAGGAGFYFVEE